MDLSVAPLNLDGAAFPVAFTVQATVTSAPLSADVSEPTCFFLFLFQSAWCLHCCNASLIHILDDVWKEAILKAVALLRQVALRVSHDRWWRTNTHEPITCLKK